MTDGRPTYPSPAGGAGQGGRDDESSAIGQLLRDWESELDRAVSHEAARAVRSFLQELQQHKGASDALKRLRGQGSEDALLAFAYYCLSRLTDGGAPTAKAQPSPAAQPAAPAAGQRPVTPASTSVAVAPGLRDARAAWREKVPDLAAVGFAELLEAMAEASVEPAARRDAEMLRALLEVYFGMDWSGTAESLLELAYRAGELLCKLIMALPETDEKKNRLMLRGCELLNRQRQFASQFRCESLTARSAYDSRRCEQPEGSPRHERAVRPLSFCIVRKPDGEVRRKARVAWI